MNELDLLLEKALVRLSEQYRQDIEALSMRLNEANERSEKTNQLCLHLAEVLQQSEGRARQLEAQLRAQGDVWQTLAGQVKGLEKLLTDQTGNTERLRNSLQGLIQRLNELS